MRTPLLVACWLAVLALGVFLRFEGLADRPFHADEATGALITAKRMEAKGYVFDPLHYHGPTLSGAGMLSARLHGMSGWAALEKGALRLVPAVAGSLLVLLPLLGHRRYGSGPMLIAALALATSPLLVYYSRMYIHEMLLTLFGVLALFQFATTKRWWLAGVWVGLMYATKESFAITMVAWGGAAAALYLLHLWRKSAPGPVTLWKDHGRQALLAGGLALVVALVFYSNFFTSWQGVVDAVRTYFVYDLVEGHEKPMPYYFEMMLLPRKVDGVWWFETTVALLALAAVAGSLVSRSLSRPARLTIWFLALAAGGHFAIYSLIGYKTPWLMVLPWAHLCLLAGFITTLPLRGRLPQIGVGVVTAAFFASQFLQSRQATGTFASDDRNPYAYVPTSDDIETLETWLAGFDVDPERPLEPIAVVGAGFWPLPWYLKNRPRVYLYAEAPANIERLPLIFATGDLTGSLVATHVPVPRGLRTDTPVTVWVRNDFWDASLAD